MRTRRRGVTDRLELEGRRAWKGKVRGGTVGMFPRHMLIRNMRFGRCREALESRHVSFFRFGFKLEERPSGQSVVC